MKALKDYKINLSPNEMKELFDLFDRDGSGTIDYDEFLRQVRGEMNDKRKQIVLQAFDKLDLDKSGKVEYNEIKSLYNVKNHKDVLSGKKTEEDIYNEFIETFEIHHNLYYLNYLYQTLKIILLFHYHLIYYYHFYF